MPFAPLNNHLFFPLRLLPARYPNVNTVIYQIPSSKRACIFFFISCRVLLFLATLRRLSLFIHHKPWPLHLFRTARKAARIYLAWISTRAPLLQTSGPFLQRLAQIRRVCIASLAGPPSPGTTPPPLKCASSLVRRGR